jgi:hypothetical protein
LTAPLPKKVETLVQQPKTFYELIESKQETILFNRAKIKGFLNHYGKYPNQYRQMIWRYILKLPENRAGYEALLNQGTHSSFKDFRKKFPLKSDKAAKSMERYEYFMLDYCRAWHFGPRYLKTWITCHR